MTNVLVLNPDLPDHDKLLQWPDPMLEKPEPLTSAGWRYGKSLIVKLAVWTKVVDTVSRDHMM